VADIVAVEDEGPASLQVELLLERVRDRGLARAREPGEPQRDAAMALELLAPLAGDGGMMPDGVGALHDERLIPRD
jgi:hypothetical protein